MREFVAEALRLHAKRLALVTEDGVTWTYAHLEAEARKIAARVPASSLVVIEGDNSPALIAAYLGALMNGALVHLAEAGRAAALRPSFGPLVHIRCESETAVVEADGNLASAPALHPDLALLFSTSGTTGTSKMVKITAANIRSNSEAIIAYLDLQPGQRAITSLKPTYTFGLSVINSHLLSGGALLLTNRSVQDPAFWIFARAQGANVLAGVPHTYEVLANDSVLEQTPSLHLLLQAGGKLRPDLVRRFAERGRLADWRFCVMYGQTEASPRMAYLPPELAETEPEAIGVAIPGGELSIEDERGGLIEAAGIEGELIYRGPNIMAGYATGRTDLATAQPLSKLPTGDLAVRQSNGLYVITGRRARFIKPLGRRISLDDVEQLLAAQGISAAALPQGEGLLVVYESAGPLPAAPLATQLGLPAPLVATRQIKEIPRLPSGKTDYVALGSCTPEKDWLPASILRFLNDTTADAWRLLIGSSGRAQALTRIFSEVLRRPVAASDSFASLGVDSLIYVELSIALEDATGPLPEGWIHMTVGELEHWQQNEP